MLNGEESGWKMHATLKKGKSVLAFDRIVLAFDRSCCPEQILADGRSRRAVFSARGLPGSSGLLNFDHVLRFSTSSEPVSAQNDQMPAGSDQKSARIDQTPAESGSFQPDSIKNHCGSINNQRGSIKNHCGSIKNQCGSIKCRRESNARRQNRAVSAGRRPKAGADRADQSTRMLRGA